MKVALRLSPRAPSRAGVGVDVGVDVDVVVDGAVDVSATFVGQVDESTTIILVSIATTASKNAIPCS